MSDTLFVNQKYVPKLGTHYKRYVNNNGVLKEFKLGVLASKLISKDLIWFKLDELPRFLQERLLDKALTMEEIFEMSNKSIRSQDFIDKEDVKVYIADNTEIMPVVGNFLPSDGVDAYFVDIVDDKISLKPILICYGFHWADLFSGMTKYKNNVFCLASDLTPEQREYFKDDIIELKDVLDFLENNNIKKLS